MRMMKVALLSILATLILAGAVLADEPPTVTAYQIQRYDGVNEGDRIRFTGITTVESPRYGYALTVACDPGGGEWAAIFIYDTEQRLVAERAQIVDVVGVVTEYYDKTEIFCSDETEFPPQALNEYGSLPPNILTTTGQMAYEESLEATIIELRNVQVLSDPNEYGLIAIDDGSGEAVLLLRKDDPAPAIGFTYDCLIGNDDYSFGEFRIRPRDENDWVCSGTQPTPTPGTNTPTPGPGTPTPTPSGGVCAPDLLLEFQNHTPDTCFKAGDEFHATWTMTNNCGKDVSVDLYLCLQVFDLWFFGPSWGSDLSHIAVTIPDGDVFYEDILPSFSWPADVGAVADGLAFWGVMLLPDTYDLTGEIEMLTFCYN